MKLWFFLIFSSCHLHIATANGERKSSWVATAIERRLDTLKSNSKNAIFEFSLRKLSFELKVFVQFMRASFGFHQMHVKIIIKFHLVVSNERSASAMELNRIRNGTLSFKVTKGGKMDQKQCAKIANVVYLRRRHRSSIPSDSVDCWCTRSSRRVRGTLSTKWSKQCGRRSPKGSDWNGREKNERIKIVEVKTIFIVHIYCARVCVRSMRRAVEWKKIFIAHHIPWY